MDLIAFARRIEALDRHLAQRYPLAHFLLTETLALLALALFIPTAVLWVAILCR